LREELKIIELLNDYDIEIELSNRKRIRYDFVLPVNLFFFYK